MSFLINAIGALSFCIGETRLAVLRMRGQAAVHGVTPDFRGSEKTREVTSFFLIRVIRVNPRLI
jgi:hypothetical protein